MAEARHPRLTSALPWIAAAAGCVVVALVLVAAAISGAPPGSFGAGISPAGASLIELQQTTTNRAAPDFALTDQHGRAMDLRRFRGRPVVLTFNDDECQDLCTLLAEDVAAANRDLGADAKDVAYVSINANPFHTGVADVRDWSDSHGLGTASNWYYGTGTPATLARIAKSYHCAVEADRTTGEVVHCATMYFIDPSGHERALGSFGSDSADTAPFAHAVAQMAVDLSGRSVHVAGPSLAAPTGNSAQVGDTPPALRLPVASGTAPSSGEGLHVVDFFSSTCTACRAQLATLQHEHVALGSAIDITGIDVDEGASLARTLATRNGVDFPVMVDAHGATAGSWRVSALPFLVVLDAHGTVLIRHAGAMTTEQLDYILRDLDPSLPAAGS